MSESVIDATNLTYRVGSSTLVAGVNFNADAGEIVAVLGPNGAGKSTLLSLLAGTKRPTEGRVLLMGLDTVDTTARDLALIRSVLSQGSRGDIPYTVAQVVAMGRFPYRRDPANSSEIDQQLVKAAMDRTDTARFADRTYATLSAGEQTRVSLARVFAQNTLLVFLDEPTTALDVANQERIMKGSVSIVRQGRTFITVLHDLNSAAVYADRLVMMNQGRIVATGSAREVLTSKLLSDVYQQTMIVVEHPFRDCPLVLPG